MSTTQPAPKDRFTFGSLPQGSLFLTEDEEGHLAFYWKMAEGRACKVRNINPPQLSGNGGRIDIDHTSRMFYANDRISSCALAGDYEAFQDVLRPQKVSLVNIL